MTLKLRFALLLGFLLGGFLIALAVLRGLERASSAALVRNDREARAQLLSHWIDVTSRALPLFAGDLAQSEEFVGLLNRPEVGSDAREKISASLASAGATWLWVLGEDGKPRFHAAAAGRETAAEFPLSSADFIALVAETPAPRFFAEIGADLIEICVRRLQPPASAEHRDWIAVARHWDDAQLRALSALTESRVSLNARHELATAPVEDPRLAIVRPLTDWHGRALRVLRVEYEIPEIDRAVQAHAQQSRVFIVFGLLLLTALGLALQQWVLRPLRQIGDSMGSQNGALVAALSQEKSELGRVAGLVLASFSQRDALEREVAERKRTQEELERSEAALRRTFEERARLGRDLHDGVIQSLYAAGMGLAGIRTQLNPEQTEAAARLEQTRAALNETIHDVRNFISGLEPEALKLQTFSHAIGALLEAMSSMGAFRPTVDVDEELAAQLTLAQRVHALQIAREAVSNALRHGHATHIGIALRRHGEFAEFEVVDDGLGFDIGASAAGKGLVNFTARARELGGELAVSSQPGKGTRVQLVFSLLIL